MDQAAKLETMKRTNHLFEKIIELENLYWAAKKAMRLKRFKKAQSAFYFHLENDLLSIRNELFSAEYRPKPYKTFEIREPKVRKICAADFRDRIAHHAICRILEPIFERKLIFDSYACRKDKGSHKAVQRVQIFSNTNACFLKCDIQKYFESIDHERLKYLLRKTIKDRRLISLLDQIIDHAVPGNPMGKGLPIGNLTSQYFANLYLDELDHFVKERLKIKGYVRYMDDMILLSNEKEKLKDVLKAIEFFLHENLKLHLKQKATEIGPVTNGIPFLGFRIYPNLIRVQRTNLIRWRKKLRKKEMQYRQGHIKEEDLSTSVRSMIAHMAHANSMMLRRNEVQV